jgi:hypothetical protein
VYADVPVMLVRDGTGDVQMTLDGEEWGDVSTCPASVEGAWFTASSACVLPGLEDTAHRFVLTRALETLSVQHAPFEMMIHPGEGTVTGWRVGPEGVEVVTSELPIDSAVELSGDLKFGFISGDASFTKKDHDSGHFVTVDSKTRQDVSEGLASEGRERFAVRTTSIHPRSGKMIRCSLSGSGSPILPLRGSRTALLGCCSGWSGDASMPKATPAPLASWRPRWGLASPTRRGPWTVSCALGFRWGRTGIWHLLNALSMSALVALLRRAPLPSR